MTELQNETIAGDRGITPVGGGDHGRTAMLKRGFGALALTAFAFLIIWGTWKGDKPVSDSTRKLHDPPGGGVRARPGSTGRTDHHGLNWAAPVAATPAAPVPAPTSFWKAPDARQCWPITGRFLRGVRPATA